MPPLTSVPRLTALRADHLPQAVDLSKALSWPYRDQDWQVAFDLGAGFAVEVDDRLVATAMWWSYGQSHASVGMIIVDPAMPGRGLGRALMEALLQATSDRTVILNATLEGLPLYAKLGFISRGQVFQHQAVLKTAPELANGTADIRVMRASDEAQARRLDLVATGMDRTALLTSLFSTGTVMVIDQGDGASAFACVREFGHGVVIGPVVAGGANARPDAKRLIAALAGRHQGRFVRLDVTEESALSGWLADLGLPCVGQAQPMVLGDQASVPTGGDTRLFALANQSFG
jgi:GNAT superfamily N-acetyltransferase